MVALALNGCAQSEYDGLMDQELESDCHSSYSGCLNRPGDYDCRGGSGNGPNYTGRVQVIGPDVYRLDRDGDGIGCE